jgi:hypothetical protein
MRCWRKWWLLFNATLRYKNAFMQQKDELLQRYKAEPAADVAPVQLVPIVKFQY